MRMLWIGGQSGLVKAVLAAIRPVRFGKGGPISYRSFACRRGYDANLREPCGVFSGAGQRPRGGGGGGVL